MRMREFPRNIQTALRYLRNQVQQNGAIVIFGSRARDSSKKNADFDIGLFFHELVSWRVFSVSKTRVEELAWPYRIHLVDLTRAPADFLRVAKGEMILLYGDWNGLTRAEEEG